MTFLPSLLRRSPGAPGAPTQPVPVGFVVAFERRGHWYATSSDIVSEEQAHAEAARWRDYDQGTSYTLPHSYRVCAVIPLEEP